MVIQSGFRIRHGIHMLMVCACFVPFLTWGQADWPGVWKMRYKPWPHLPEVRMSLHVAEPVMDMLYPTKLELSYGPFSGSYELLLVKKSSHSLGIGRNKIPIGEDPFGLGPWMMYLNGVFELQDDDMGGALVLKRIWMDNLGVFMTGVYNQEWHTNEKVFLRDFLYQAAVKLKRVSNEPWTAPGANRMVQPDSLYYGVYDPIESTSAWLRLSVQDEERYDRDTVTIVHNGVLVADRLPIEQVLALDSIRLDTGENYLAFFADNYGVLPPNTAKFLVGTAGDEGQLYAFNFSDPANAYATVMVACFRYHPQPPSDSIAPQISVRKGRRNFRIGGWRVKTERLVLELRDEQFEDGDIIALGVNGARVADHVEVDRKPKRIGVSLVPGPNRIIFTAENLGSIPPNTASLRVIAGNEVRTFHLSTDFEQNNVLDIYLE